MSKLKSFYDWESNFKKRAVFDKNSEKSSSNGNIKRKVNSIGMTDELFRIFMKK